MTIPEILQLWQEEMVGLEPEIIELVDKHFWELI